MKPLLSVSPKKYELEANRLISKSKFTRFNKDLECYQGSFDGDLYGNSLVVVVAETGMFQFFKEIRTNHRKDVTIVVKCSKSCKQLDANRSQFRSDGHKDVFEELKRRVSEVGEIEAIMSPEVGNLDPEDIVKDYSKYSSTDPIGAFLSSSIGVDDINGSFSLGPLKKENRERIKNAIKKKKEMFAKRQSRELAVVPVAAQGHLSMIDPRVTLARHTSKHIDYLIEKSRPTIDGVIPSPPYLFGTVQSTRLKLYRIFCIAVNMVYSVRESATVLGLGGKLCSSEVRVVLDIRDDQDGKAVHATHAHSNGKCVIGVNLLRLVDGKAEIRHDTKGMDMTQKSMMSLLDTIIHEVAHCLTHTHPSKSECGEDHCLHFYETESKLRSHLISSGVTLQRQCIPAYVKKVCQYSKKLSLETIPAPRGRKKKVTEKPVSVRVYLTRSRARMNNREGRDGEDHFSEAGSSTCSGYDSGGNADGNLPSHYVTEASEKDAVEDSPTGSSSGDCSDDNSTHSSTTKVGPRKIEPSLPATFGPELEDNGDYFGDSDEEHGLATSTHEAFKSPASGATGATFSTCRIEDAIDGNLSLSSPVQPDDHWVTVSNKLQAAGWMHRKGSGLDSWHYIFPSGKPKAEGGIEGIDYLRSLRDMKMFAIEHLGWAGDDTIGTKGGPRSSSKERSEGKCESLGDGATSAPFVDKERTDDSSKKRKKKSTPSSNSSPGHGLDDATKKKRTKKRSRFTHNKNENRSKNGTKHPLHDHPLVVSSSKRKQKWACDACTPSASLEEDQEYPFSETDKRYSCALNKNPPCDFDLCESCFLRGNEIACTKNISPAKQASHFQIPEHEGEAQSLRLESKRGTGEPKPAIVDEKHSGEDGMSDYSHTTVPPQDLVSAPSVLVFERRGVNGSHHRVSVIVGRGGVKFESSLRDAMVKAKQLNAALFRSKTKAFVMEINSGEDPLPFTIESAKSYSVSDLFELGCDSLKTVNILVKDAPELDEEESDIDF